MDGEKFDPIVILMQGLSTAVNIEEGRSLAEAEGLFFMVTFALDSMNVKTAFEMVIREIYSNMS